MSRESKSKKNVELAQRSFGGTLAWFIMYSGTIGIYKMLGISDYPTFTFFIIIPLIISTINALTLYYRINKKFSISTTKWATFFLLLHSLIGVAVYHKEPETINGFIGLMIMIQALLFLNSTINYIGTASIAIMVLFLTVGINFLEFGIVQSDDVIFLIIGGFLSVVCCITNYRSCYILTKTRILHQESEKNRKEIQQKTSQLESLSSKLAKYLSPQIYHSIFSGEKDVKVETSRKKLTVFFSDIKGFTDLTDSMESEALTSLLNSYINEMSEIALRYGGTIDKYIGDAIMIFFGDPETIGEKEDALACVLMAMEMQERMKYLRNKWRKEGLPKELHIRCGINTGYCTVGNFGSEKRLAYTIIGGQVNLASRLESSSMADQILISESTYLLIHDQIHCQKKEEITVKGIAHPIQTYQVVNYSKRLIDPDLYLSQEGKGFSITVDFEQVNKNDLTAILEELNNRVAKQKTL